MIGDSWLIWVETSVCVGCSVCAGGSIACDGDPNTAIENRTIKILQWALEK